MTRQYSSTRSQIAGHRRFQQAWSSRPHEDNTHRPPSPHQANLKMCKRIQCRGGPSEHSTQQETVPTLPPTAQPPPKVGSGGPYPKEVFCQHPQMYIKYNIQTN